MASVICRSPLLYAAPTWPVTNEGLPSIPSPIRPAPHASRPPASLYHVRLWVIGSVSSHYVVPVECSSSSPLTRGLFLSPSHRVDRSDSPHDCFSLLGWVVHSDCKIIIWHSTPTCALTNSDTHMEIFLLFLFNFHTDCCHLIIPHCRTYCHVPQCRKKEPCSFCSRSKPNVLLWQQLLGECMYHTVRTFIDSTTG